ncbi:serine hydrolase domain-containing protein [Agromyces neolithicus]|uniref:Beta-lactamase-related domain-containing protein n=1 Tax=Agromyces neolithicus TaxID=269420 RepID=A0ABN2LZH0_9MICO
MAASRAAWRGISLLSIMIAVAPLAGCVAAPAEAGRVAGDADIVTEIGSTFAEDYERAAIAVIHGDDVRTAFVGAGEDTAFEIGSITKVLTGELFAIAIERGEVSPDDMLGEHLDLGDAPVASVTLTQLATHHAGLPHFSEDPGWSEDFEQAYAAREDPLDDDLAELIELARGAEAAPESEFEYSNVGAALLGQALASAAGIEYPELLQQRVLDPLGMVHAVLVEQPGQVPETHAGGFNNRGEPVEPWSIGAFSPAGGVHATLGDLIALAQAVLDGDLERSPALDPVAEAMNPRTQIGYFWFIEQIRPRTITHHPGQTGGFGAALIINRDSDIAAIVLTNTESDVFRLGLQLLIAAER